MVLHAKIRPEKPRERWKITLQTDMKKKMGYTHGTTLRKQRRTDGTGESL
jgi:hypothetical protein